MSTSAILTGLENLPMKEKALRKATELQKKSSRAEKNLQVIKCHEKILFIREFH